MDVQDSLGTDGADAGRTPPEPPGHDPHSGAASDRHGHDRHGDGSATGTNDGSTEDGPIGGYEERASTDGGTITVEVDGRARELPAERDYTGDGQADAVVETADGKVIVFADTENNETGDGGP